MSEYNTTLSNNNDVLEEILAAINALPTVGGGTCPLEMTADGGIWVPTWNDEFGYAGKYAFNGGYQNEANDCQAGFGVIGAGSYEGAFLAGIQQGLTGTYYDNHELFFVGNGRYESYDCTPSNAFSVNYRGNAFLGGTLLSPQADYAEMFEWIDGNPNAEDRRGLMVVIDGEKIRLAAKGETPDGIISARPTVLGDNAHQQWHAKYLTDVFGEPLLEQVELRPEEILDNGEVIPAEYGYRKIINPEYDRERKYIPRDQRPEWTPVGFMGKLVTVDDGTCVPGGRCACGGDGIATASDSGWKVLSRLDDTHIKVFVK